MKVEVLFLQSLAPYKKWQTWYLREDTAEHWEKKGKVQIMKSNKSMADRPVAETKDYSWLTKKEIMEELDSKGIEYKEWMNKKALLELLD